MGRRIRGVVVGVACCFFHRMSEKVSLIKITFEQSCEKSSGETLREKDFRQLAQQVQGPRGWYLLRAFGEQHWRPVWLRVE